MFKENKNANKVQEMQITTQIKWKTTENLDIFLILLHEKFIVLETGEFLP